MKISLSRGMIVLYLLTHVSLSLGETQEHAGSDKSASTPNSPRASQAAPITDREMKFISDNFFISQKTIWTKFSEKLPRALESAMKDKNEKEAGLIVAELMGMINGEQAKLVLDNAVKERDSEKAKKPSGGDERFIALMERFVWGAKAFLKSPSKEENAEKYNKEFNEAFKGVASKNEEIREKIKQAADGNEQAKDWLRKNLDQSSLLSFAEGQKKYGNTELADRLIDAVSFKEGKNKFLDMSNQNETQRLHLGQTSKSVSQAVDKFFEAKQGFNGAVAAFAPLQGTPMKQWFVDDSGKFQTGSPKTFPTYSQNNSSASNRLQTTNGNSGQQSSTTQNSANSGNSSAVSDAGNVARAKIVSSCRECHADASIDANGNFLKKPGAPRTKDKLLAALDTVPDMVQNFTNAERAELKALIQQWVR